MTSDPGESIAVPDKVPERPVAEWALTLAKAAASLIPFAGGPAAEVISAIIQPQLDRRKTEWLENMAHGLNLLSQRVDEVTPERLAQSPEFTTVFLQASQIAMRTHQAEKLVALRNAVLNVAANPSLLDDVHMMFLDAVDTLTPSHLQVLAYFVAPRDWAKAHGILLSNYVRGGADQPLQEAITELKGRRDLIDLIYNDLSRRGLVTGDANLLHITASAEGMVEPRSTALGRQFLAFLESPPLDVET